MKILVSGKPKQVLDVLSDVPGMFKSYRRVFREEQADDHFAHETDELAILPDALEVPFALWRTVKLAVLGIVCVFAGHDDDVEHDGEWGRHVNIYCRRCYRHIDGGWF